MKLFKAGFPFSITPSVDFRKYISRDRNRIMEEAWSRTWRDLRKALGQVEKKKED